MSIKYFLRILGGSTSAAGKYTAQVKHSNTIYLADLIDKVAARKTAIGKGDIASTIETLCEVIETEVTEGNTVHLGGIARFWATIKGTFETPSSPYDPADHSVSVAAAAESRLRKEVADNTSVERIDPPSHVPLVQEFEDVTLNKDDETRASDLAQITGSSLSFDDSDPLQGVFFCDAIGSEPPIKITTFQKAGDKEIVFQQPISFGSVTECYMEVRRKQTPTGSMLTGKTNNLTTA